VGCLGDRYVLVSDKRVEFWPLYWKKMTIPDIQPQQRRVAIFLTFAEAKPL